VTDSSTSNTITPQAYAGGLLLALDGVLPDAAFVNRLRPRHTLLVAADGAALKLRERGIRPDVVIGDLDSAGAIREVLIAEGMEVIEEPSQELNDFEKVLRWVIGRGERSATVIGIGGGMTDHALNNFSVLARYARSIRLSVWDEESIAYAVHDSIVLNATPGDRISLIPLPRVRLTATGLAWELDDVVLGFGKREGASNRAAESVVNIRVTEGVVMVFHYRHDSESWL
jgi:thiamine pyrophosphokinase